VCRFIVDRLNFSIFFLNNLILWDKKTSCTPAVNAPLNFSKRSPFGITTFTASARYRAFAIAYYSFTPYAPAGQAASDTSGMLQAQLAVAAKSVIADFR
jgi:hypothetical protein